MQDNGGDDEASRIVRCLTSDWQKIEDILRRLEVPDGPKLGKTDLPLKWNLYFKIGFKHDPDWTAGIRTQQELGTLIEDLPPIKCRLAKLRDSFKELPPELIEWMEHKSDVVTALPLEDQQEIAEGFYRPEHASYQAILDAIGRELCAAEKMLRVMRRIYWPAKTKAKDALAYQIALDIAELYFSLQGTLPTYNYGPAKRTSLYVQTVLDVFNAKGIDAKPKGPCKNGINQLKAVKEG